jgi:hypothetical protein
MDALTKVHAAVIPTYTGQEGIRNCVELCRIPDINLSEKEAKFCFGMSKMTVKDEVKNHAEYDKLKIVEFLEFVGRVAATKYFADTESPLNEKIEKILDPMLKCYGFKRNAVP